MADVPFCDALPQGDLHELPLHGEATGLAAKGVPSFDLPILPERCTDVDTLLSDLPG